MVKLCEGVLVLPAVVQELAAGRALGFDLLDLTAFPWVSIVRSDDHCTGRGGGEIILAHGPPSLVDRAGLSSAS
jgi:hypothetical protein